MPDSSPHGSTGAAVRPGDVLSYLAGESHCREGTAFIRDDGVAVDTFWRPCGDGQSHVLTARELATAEVRFNVNDYDALDRYSPASRRAWETYHPDDRGRITSQHGLQEALFIRKGATPDMGTQVANARSAIADAESDVRCAEAALAMRRRALEELTADA